MTPLAYAELLAGRSATPQEHAEAVAIIARGLSDPSPSDPFRLPWDVETSLIAACRYLNLDASPRLIEDARNLMDTITDATLNRQEA